MRRQHRMHRVKKAIIVASAAAALLAACTNNTSEDGGTPVSIDEAVTTGQTISEAIGSAAVSASLSPESRAEFETVEWRDDACMYSAPGWTLAVPAGENLDDPLWTEQIKALDPAVQENGLEPFVGPVLVDGVPTATSHSSIGVVVELTSDGHITIEQPVNLDKSDCNEKALPAG